MKTITFTPAALAALCTLVLVVGCHLGGGNSAGAASGLTGDVSHLYVVLTGPHAIKASSTGRSTEAVSQDAQVIGCPGIGTISYDDASLGYWPIKTCAGYYANMSEAPTSADSSIPLPPQGNYQVFFEGANCTGNAYTREAPGISGKALASGFIFFMDIGGTGRGDADNYWVVEKGEQTASATVFSDFNGAVCQSIGNTPSESIDLTSVYPIKHNTDVLDQDGNPSSGLASAPIQGPLTSGTP
jgi:hypothetical protein